MFEVEVVMQTSNSQARKRARMIVVASVDKEQLFMLKKNPVDLTVAGFPANSTAVSARYLAISLVCSVVEKLVFITGTSYFKEGLAKCRNTLTFTLFHVQFLFFSMARQKDKVFLLVTPEKLSLGK